MEKPTDADIDAAINTLEQAKEYLEETEPYAVKSIRDLEDAIETLDSMKGTEDE